MSLFCFKIYICGGFNGNECLQTAEYFNPETNQWTMISPMNSRRSGIGVIAYADHVFAVRPQSSADTHVTYKSNL